MPWKCVTSGGHLVWAAGRSLIDSQIVKNLAWARQNGIPAESGVLAAGEYSGLKLLPQQPVNNPYLDQAMSPNKIKWVAMDASREPNMRPVGAAFGVPGTPIDVGYDVDTAAAEVNEFDWFKDSRPTGQRDLPGQQGDEMPQAAEPEDRLDLGHRAGTGPDHLPGPAEQRPAAVLHASVRPDR